ncbi:MAG: malonic semialdehyde reductase [Rhodobacteraceae bacterium]|nr:malonic semialdehyde reductase [Paracoccaceae bacterium]
MNQPDPELTGLIFEQARSCKFFSKRKIDESTLRQVYALASLAPTSNNTCPMRIVFAQSAAAREMIIEALAPGNVEKTRSAPVTAIIAHDLEFYRHLPLLAPHMAESSSSFEAMPDDAFQQFVLRNSSIQGGIFMIAARLCGLDCGPMSGFRNARIDELFFANSTWRSNFLINLGYGTDEGLRPRADRLSFDDACILA